MTDPLRIDYHAKYHRLVRRHLLILALLAGSLLVNLIKDHREERELDEYRSKLQKDVAMMTYAQRVITNLTAADKKLEIDCKQLADLPQIQRPTLNCHTDGDLTVCDDFPKSDFERLPGK